MFASLLTLPPLLVYAALFAVVAAESAGLPLPGETSLIAAGVLASQHGKIAILPVIGVAGTAAIAGDNVGYLLGRRSGRWLLTRDGRWATTRRRYLERGERFFAQHGPKAVFVARWLPGFRVVGAWLAGAHRMRWRTFLLWNALGGLAWAISVGLAAYILGQAAADLFKRSGLVAVLLVAATIGVLLGLRYRRHRHQRPLLQSRSE
jgi:membrane protein DedA with SNARE-associated domain